MSQIGTTRCEFPFVLVVALNSQVLLLQSAADNRNECINCGCNASSVIVLLRIERLCRTCHQFCHFTCLFRIATTAVMPCALQPPRRRATNLRRVSTQMTPEMMSISIRAFRGRIQPCARL